jgi:hypothetical protein
MILGQWPAGLALQQDHPRPKVPKYQNPEVESAVSEDVSILSLATRLAKLLVDATHAKTCNHFDYK